MPSAYQQLTDVFTRLAHLDHASTYLTWDQMVMMPEQGIERRSQTLAELAALRHAQLSNDALGDWFDEAQATATGDTVASVREMRRQWDLSRVLPAELVKQQIMAGAKCEHAWRTQREHNDWDGFLVNFREVVALAREEARIRQSAAPDQFDTPYDALLDLHCAGDTSELISEVFTALKAVLPDMISTLSQRETTGAFNDNDHYPIEAQKALSEALMAQLGFDFSAGRLDVSVHPFSTGGRGDARITTRYRDNEFMDALLATAHETGHASYESGLPADWALLPVGGSRNMSIHESQSLLFEKQLLLAKPFLAFLTQLIHQHLPDSRQYDADTLWRHATVVKPSFVRVEADEVTYPLHVILRYEIESALINGDMEPDAIPTVWDEKMQQYLGLSTGNNHKLGCLQDIHWTDGAFGYFPSYTLGAVNAAQLFHAMTEQHTDWEQRFADGDTSFVRAWLSEHIWQRGSFLSSQELMVQATGETTNAQHLINHLRARYL